MKKVTQADKTKNVWIIEKIESTFTKRTGFLGRAKTYNLSTDDSGNEVTEFAGDFDGVKFAESREDISPLYINRKWQFAGDDATLKELIGQIKLTYPEGHLRAGELITEANLNNEIDPFFSHPHWRDGARFTMIGGKQVVSDDDPEFKFLLLCLKGGTQVTTDDEIFEAAGSKYRIVKSNVDRKSDVSDSLSEMEMASDILNLTPEKSGLISVILGLALEENILDTDSTKANLLTNLKRKEKNPNGDVRLFEGKTYKGLFADLKGNDLAELNKKANIKKAMNKNILRYRDGKYELRGSKIDATTFSDLVAYFKSEDGLDDYTKLTDALNA